MNEVKKREKHLRKAKNWNMVLLVISGLATLLNMTSIPTILNPEMPDLTELEGTIEITPQMTAYYQELYDVSNTFFSKAYSIGEILVSIGIVVLLVLNHRRIKEEILPMKAPYYLTFLLAVLSIVYTLAFVPTFGAAGIVASIAVAVGVGFVKLFTVVPAIIALVHTFKADVEG